MPFKAEVCLTCGDTGFPEALVYCSKCSSYAVHRYCLPTVILRSDVSWLCDDCVSSALGETVHDRHCSKDIKEEQQLEETNGLVQMLSNESNTSSTRGSIPPGFEKYIEAQQIEVSLLRGGVNISREDSIVACCQGAADFKETKSHDPPTPKVPTIGVDCSNGNKNEQQLEEKNGQVGVLSIEASTSSILESILPCFQKYIEAHPIEVPIWRGGISVSRQDSVVACCQLAAYLSSRASPIVCDAAKSLPRMLAPNLMPRSDLWPKGFRRWGPSDNSIGLYFFPSDERSANNYEGLVNTVISNDLAMRTVTESAELLIFASNVLPLACTRFREKFYLWGVFKRKRPTLDVEPKVVANIGAGSPVSTLYKVISP